jgi:propanediol dehydratase small subunit
MSEYPLLFRAADKLKTATGKKLEDITLEAIGSGDVTMEDLRVSAEALEMQAAIAAEANRPQLAENLRRAAELVDVPEPNILEIYQALRPGRATAADLERLATELETEYEAPLTAALLRDAATIPAASSKRDQ